MHYKALFHFGDVRMFDPDRRYWLLTWTTYGTWLPGEDRGFVSTVRESSRDMWKRRNELGTVYSHSMPGLRRASQSRLKCSPIYLDIEQAQAVFKQFQETAAYRGWHLEAVAIMANHAHLVVSLGTDVAPDVLLRDFKSYASRALSVQWDKPASGTWWAESGSKRKKSTRSVVENAIRYVARQERPLLVWVDNKWQSLLVAPARG
jgi:REP element-mobilizing transposase RayT